MEAPDYNAWLRYLVVDWVHPTKPKETSKYVGFAMKLSSFGFRGKRIWPSRKAYGERLHLCEKQAGRIRAELVELELFRKARSRMATEAGSSHCSPKVIVPRHSLDT
jgi:hypothetical protein